MKKLVIAGLAVVALAAPAFAADMPTKAPLYAPAFNWTGWYVGVNAGGAWNRSIWTDVTPLLGSSPSLSASGFIGGAQIGYNYQVNRVVLGIEGDFDGVGLTSGAACAGAPPATCTTKQNWLASIRGRVGYAFDRSLVYATGGVAFTRYKQNLNFSPIPPSVDFNDSRTGWVGGLGYEYAITNNWIAGIEWKYYDFGTKSGTFPGAGPGIENFKETENTVVGRISYKFGP